MKQDATGSSGSVSAEDIQNDAFYTCPVQIGTPAQTVDLNFDSGSSDLWCWSTSLDRATQDAGEQQGIKIFDPKGSKTFNNAQGYRWMIRYGDGSGASGTVGTDVVKIGDVVIEHQAVEIATQVSSSFRTEQSSGLCGLAFGTINTVKPNQVKTPVENMISQKDITNPIWSVYLGSVKDLSDPDQGKSFYTFGNYDHSVVEASGQEIAYTPIDSSQGFWMFSSESASVNGKIVALPGNQAIADTGTTLMLVSDDFCEAIYSAITGAQNSQKYGGWVIPAGNVSQRPVVKVAVGKTMITIEKEQLGWADIGDGSDMVFGGIQSRGENSFDILGDTLLICCYAIFDFGQKRLGVVQRADPTPAGR